MVIASYHLQEMWQNLSWERLLYNPSKGLLLYILLSITISMATVKFLCGNLSNFFMRISVFATELQAQSAIQNLR